MNRLIAALGASMLALGSISALGVELTLTDEERIELRQRLERLQAERAQNAVPRPDDVALKPQRGDVRLKPKGGEARLNQQRGEVNTKVAKAKKAKRKKRSLKDLPGALVR